MFIYEPMTAEDIFSLDVANLDGKSENFTFEYYLHYLENYKNDFITARCMFWPEYIKDSDMLYTNPIIGYIFGKKETKERWVPPPVVMKEIPKQTVTFNSEENK